MNTPLVSIIILSYNRAGELVNTLHEIEKQTYKNIEIIVVDNNSSDNTCQLLESGFKCVKLIKLQQNTGIKGYNIGFLKSHGEFVVILDDDSYPAPEAVEKAVKTMSDNPQIGALAFRILDKNGVTVTNNWPDKTTSFWGCGAAIRADLLKKIGFYDEDYFLYCNEYDLAIRIWDAGYEVVYDQEIIACHRVSSANRPSGRLIYYSVRNDIWFNLKYFKVKYLFRTISTNMFTWLARSLLEGTALFWFKGLGAGILGAKNALKKRKPVRDEIARFYIGVHKNFEFPLKKAFRKYADGTLFKKPENV